MVYGPKFMGHLVLMDVDVSRNSGGTFQGSHRAPLQAWGLLEGRFGAHPCKSLAIQLSLSLVARMWSGILGRTPVIVSRSKALSQTSIRRHS